MKKVLVLGFGCMGRVHYDVWKTLRGAKVVGVFDKNPHALKDPPAKAYGHVEVSDGKPIPESLKLFGDLDEALRETKPDIVDCTLPTRFHVDATIAAMRAGADVLCEKPMALDAAGCAKMIAASKKYGRRLMVAQCLRFAPEYAFAKDLVATKKFGKVVVASFWRLTAPPKTPKGAKAWFFDEKLSGGIALDLNIHDTDVVRWLFGEPKSVKIDAHRRGKRVDHFVAKFGYKDAFVTTEASWAASPSFAFQFGYRIMFERATLVYDPWRKDALTVYPENGAAHPAKIKTSSPYANEIKAFLAWTEGKTKRAPVENADIAKTVSLITKGFKP